MKPQPQSCAFAILLVILFGVSQSVGQSFTNSASRVLADSTELSVNSVTSSSVQFREPKLIGTFRPDGRYKQLEGNRSGLNAGVQPKRVVLRPIQVPPGVDLHPLERVIADYQPPAKATAPLRSHSLFASLRDRLITFAYGYEQVWIAPTHMTTDSRQRLIVSDPDQVSIHVIAGNESFRIQGGPGRRLQKPNGIAVDLDDNIYVADGKRDLILVYNPEGRFIRSIGQLREETAFEEPTAIAIDARSGKLYVLDTPANELVTLDLQGTVLSRCGGRRTVGPVKFENPTELAIGRNQIAVLDSAGSRVHVLDFDYKLLNQFKIRNIIGPPITSEMGLGLDSDGNIFVTGPDPSSIKVYKINGELLAMMDGQGAEESRPTLAVGLWIDSSDRIYVADRMNSRVQVFQR